MYKKALRLFFVIELILVVASFIVLFLTRNRDDFSGLLAIYPMTGAIIIGIAILVLLFIESIYKVSKISSSNATISSVLLAIIPLLGVPALGWYYASVGDNRAGLELVSKICFGLGLLLSMFVIYRALKSK
jgi:hypothetical protein